MYQHWDPLKVCVVRRSYPPEFYSWITVPHVRSLFEKIATETEEDYQCIISKLNSFGVEVLRPDIPATTIINNRFVPPPMTPRDYTVMIGNTFYYNLSDSNFQNFYKNTKQPYWPDCEAEKDIINLPENIQTECRLMYQAYQLKFGHIDSYRHIIERINQEGNVTKPWVDPQINGAMISRIGKDLFFGTLDYRQDLTAFKKTVSKEFTNTRNHIINTGGHSDGTYCPVCPGLIISLLDVKSYSETFPDWEVVHLPNQSWNQVRPFLELKQKNQGKWWIPGFEQDQAVIDLVETWLTHWTGFVEETVFDVNMLIVDPKNVIVFNYNQKVFDALSKYNITPHIVPFRHRYFWDGGIHCVTTDLHREGTQQDFFQIGRAHV